MTLDRQVLEEHLVSVDFRIDRARRLLGSLASDDEKDDGKEPAMHLRV
jgi:hypothetical protein